MSGQRNCSVCTFDSLFFDEDSGFRDDRSIHDARAPNLMALREQIRLELHESQRKFAAEVEQKLQQAFNADRDLAVKNDFALVSSRSTTSLQSDPETARSSSRMLWWQGESRSDKQTKGSYQYLGMKQVDTREPTEVQVKWQEQWLEEVENGELDVYTCLGLSNCFSWTADTRKIFAKAVAVIFMQMVVPLCLLMAEFKEGIELGPAEGDLGFRLVGFTLYAYAIYSMYNGADGHCRTLLLNTLFQYEEVEMGHWLPLVVGEISNVFTAFVLIVALYSIFTTQTEPADLILNAVAVNFLCDCDGSFVDSEMKAEALETFKTFTTELFSTKTTRYEDPSVPVMPAKLVGCALSIISIAGVLGSSCFMLHPEHMAGHRDTQPGFGHHVVDFGNNITAVPDAIKL